MIPGNIVRILSRQVPNYHLVAKGIAKRSISLCVCKYCKYGVEFSGPTLFCNRVFPYFIDKGYSLVAENGTCDKAEFRRDAGKDIVLEQEGE